MSEVGSEAELAPRPASGAMGSRECPLLTAEQTCYTGGLRLPFDPNRTFACRLIFLPGIAQKQLQWRRDPFESGDCPSEARSGQLALGAG